MSCLPKPSPPGNICDIQWGIFEKLPISHFQRSVVSGGNARWAFRGVPRAVSIEIFSSLADVLL